MPLFALADADLAYGDLPLLDGAAFSMEAGERIGLIGRNGTGKSSLLRAIAGDLALEESVFLATGGASRPCQQIVIRGALGRPDIVNWAFRRQSSRGG